MFWLPSWSEIWTLAPLGLASAATTAVSFDVVLS
jgi:hypothetical protein